MSHYTDQAGDDYYALRKARRNDFIQEKRADFFNKFTNDDSIVLDFGCGTGGILERLNTGKKIGVEVNPPSVAEAQSKGIEIHADTTTLPQESVDLFISNHALEHVSNPFEHICGGLRALKKGGQAVLVVPAETPASKNSRLTHQDKDYHLYSWTPRTFANLLKEAGFEVEQSYRRPIGHSRYIKPLNKVPFLYDTARTVLATLLDRFEVICIATKT